MNREISCQVPLSGGSIKLTAAPRSVPGQAVTDTKGQLISKAIYGLLTSPKIRTDEFDLFAFLLFTANKTNSSVRFLGESTAR